MVEAEYEARLSGNSPAGAIFALKNCGWSDKHEYEHSGEITTNVRALSDEELVAKARQLGNRLGIHLHTNGAA